jgi:hypothetical protein
MLWGMLGSKHGVYSGAGFGGIDMGDMGFVIPLVLILVLQANAIFGKVGPMASVKGVIHCSLGLTAVIYGLVHYM